MLKQQLLLLEKSYLRKIVLKVDAMFILKNTGYFLLPFCHSFVLEKHISYK
jgi:hypothetical protein